MFFTIFQLNIYKNHFGALSQKSQFHAIKRSKIKFG